MKVQKPISMLEHSMFAWDITIPSIRLLPTLLFCVLLCFFLSPLIYMFLEFDLGLFWFTSGFEIILNATTTSH